MLTDRPYMRDDYKTEKTSLLVWMISVLAAGFVLQLAFSSPWFRAGVDLNSTLALTVPHLMSGHVWTLVTYGLLHSTVNLFHIGLTLGGLWILGNELEPQIGAKAMLGVFVAGLVAGALAWTGVHWHSVGQLVNGHPQELVGSTAAIYALLTLYACLHPDREMSFLVFFVFPVTLRPRHIVITLLALDLGALVAYEILGSALPFTYAASAHLGGMLTGWAYYRIAFAPGGFADRPVELEMPRWIKRSVKISTPAPVAAAPEAAAPGDIRAEVDRILDKINSHGFASLTAEEKRLLHEARQQLSRR